MNYAEWTKRARESSAPDPRAVRRVRGRLDRLLSPARSELSSLPVPAAGAAARVKARLVQGRQREREGWRWGTLLPLLAGGAAFAMAAGGLIVSASEGEQSPKERFLAGAGSSLLSEHVRMQHEGEGRVLRTGEDLLIEWELGRLSLDMAPSEATVEVRTPEGRVRLVGAERERNLTVERGPLGTTMTVHEGSAELSCADGEPRFEPADAPLEVRSCWPTTPAGLLNRARALAHSDGQRLLETVEHGLSLPGEPPVRAELLALKTSALVSTGQTAAALEAAERALAEGPDPIRALELHRTAARLSLMVGYCDRAASHFDALPSLTPEEQAHRDRCRAELEE